MGDRTIIQFPGVVLGSSESDSPELTDIQVPANNAWHAAATAALAENALWGVLLFVNAEGDFCRIPIGADHVSLRGIFEVALDDLKLD